MTGNKIKVILIKVEEILKKLDDKFTGKIELHFSQGALARKVLEKVLK